jgi:hypothetical protein
MAQIQLEISAIPHGQGLSFKRGVSDGLLNVTIHRKEIHVTHSASYARGRALGKQLRVEIAKRVSA